MKFKNNPYGSLARIVLISFFVLTLLASFASAGILYDKITSVVSTVVCDLYNGLVAIVTGVAILVFVLAGVKWTASENDPGARKAAKDAMIHAIVGMIIVVISYTIVSTVISSMLCPPAFTPTTTTTTTTII